MTRRKGSQDRRPRRQRSDYGKHRKLYKGKPTKGKRQIKSERKRGNKTELRCWVWEKVQRTPESGLKFNARVRPFMARNPPVHWRMRHNIPTEDINCKEKIEMFFEENYWANEKGGSFILMGLSHGKTKTHVKWVPLCDVLVKETNDGLKARMFCNRRMNRFWFWRK